MGVDAAAPVRLPMPSRLSVSPSRGLGAAPRSMKVGAIASPWRHDAARDATIDMLA
jgi:hypothetical protein